MSAPSRRRLLAKMKKKAYRDAYTVEHVKTTTPLQIRTLREQREWTQGKLATEAKTTQTAISRTEDPNYGNLTLNHLLKIAAALDVGLLVKLVPFSRLVKEFEDLSPQAMAAPSFMDEVSVLETWADDLHEIDAADPVFHEQIAASTRIQMPTAERTVPAITSNGVEQSSGSKIFGISNQLQSSQHRLEEHSLTGGYIAPIISIDDYRKQRVMQSAACMAAQDTHREVAGALSQAQ